MKRIWSRIKEQWNEFWDNDEFDECKYHLSSYDKRSFLIHDGFQFVKRYRQTTFFMINLFWCSEPKHILSPLGYCLNVDQMFYSYVL